MTGETRITSVYLLTSPYCSSHSGCDRRGSNSGGESDEDNEEGDYTVYECPGLAPVITHLSTRFNLPQLRHTLTM